MLYHLGTEKKILLFLDIIGFGNLVKRNDGFDANSEKFEDIALMFPSFFEGLVLFHYSKDCQKARNIKFLWMSDSIVISTDINNASVLIDDLIYLQNQFYSGGMAFRGVICIGNLYHQDNIWGEPLVRAADLEKSIVCYPRVIISKDEIAQLELSIHHLKYFEQDKLNTGFYSFSPFSPNIEILLSKESNIIHSTISVYIEMLINNYNIAPEKDKCKWRWMATKLFETINVYEEDIRKRLNIESKLVSKQ